MKLKIVLPVAALLALNCSAKAQSSDAESKKDKVFTLVDKEASFPGGTKGWGNYLRANLNADLGAKYIKLKRKETFAEVVVKVQFIVDTLGNISQVKAMETNGAHSKIVAESVRVIKEGPKWIPAEQNGRKVNYQAIQAIQWQVQAE